MINIVAIDPSLNSTAVIINGKAYSIASEDKALTKKKVFTRWFELVNEHAEIVVTSKSYKEEKVYAKSELAKLAAFKTIVTAISKLMTIHCEYTATVVVIEGYSYSSAAGHIIDLVTFGTLLRDMIYTRLHTQLVILSPSTVKAQAAKLTYPAIKKGKRVIKFEYRNNDGVIGGNFKKHEMYRALTDNDTLQTPWVNFLREHQEEIMTLKKVPTPIDDINDAILMFHITESLNGGDFDQLLNTLKTT